MSPLSQRAAAAGFSNTSGQGLAANAAAAVRSSGIPIAPAAPNAHIAPTVAIAPKATFASAAPGLFGMLPPRYVGTGLPIPYPPPPLARVRNDDEYDRAVLKFLEQTKDRSRPERHREDDYQRHLDDRRSWDHELDRRQHERSRERELNSWEMEMDRHIRGSWDRDRVSHRVGVPPRLSRERERELQGNDHPLHGDDRRSWDREFERRQHDSLQRSRDRELNQGRHGSWDRDRTPPRASLPPRLSRERAIDPHGSGKRQSGEKIVDREEPPRKQAAEADRGDRLGFSPNAQRAFDLNYSDTSLSDEDEVAKPESRKGE